MTKENAVPPVHERFKRSFRRVAIEECSRKGINASDENIQKCIEELGSFNLLPRFLEKLEDE